MKSCIAVDVGGTKMLVAEVLEDGMIVNYMRLPTGTKGKDEIVKQILSGIREYEAKFGWQSGRYPYQIGVGINGVIDPKAGIWKKLYPEDTEIALRDYLEKELEICCYIDNDVKAAVMAEHHFGAGRDCRDMIYINIGTGLAAGVITNGKLIRGSDGFAGEIGFMNFTEGRGDHVELLASGMGIRHQARMLAGQYPDTLLAESIERGVTGQELFEAVEKGDALAKRIKDTLIRMAGLMISNLTCVLSPEIVVLGGGLITDETVLGQICEAISPKAAKHLEKGVVLTQLDNDFAGLMGAAAIGLGYQKEYY